MDLKLLQKTPPWEWPDNTGIFLMRIMSDNRMDTPDRLLAAEMAGDLTVINDDLAAVLLSILLNAGEPEDLRGIAAISLGPVLELADIEEFEEPDDVPVTEKKFRHIKESLRQICLDTDIPKNVRRMTLEASIRAPEDWHIEAVQEAYTSGDELWKLTAVFSMRWIAGFDDYILEELNNEDEAIHAEAVYAAGTWEIDEAWSHVMNLLISEETGKRVLLAALEAAACIRPFEATDLLEGYIDSDDEEIVDTALRAVSMATDLMRAEVMEDEDEDENGSKLLLH